MKFISQNIKDHFLIIPEPHQDERGVFRRSYCQDEFSKYGIDFKVKQGNISENLHKHTLRGFHYQLPPSNESKIITCVTGALYNVVLDIRIKSKTYKQWAALEISSKKRESIYIPAGCANAFLTLEKNTVIQYFMGDFYKPKLYRGFRYDDPYFSIKWPKPKVISRKDLSFKKFK